MCQSLQYQLSRSLKYFSSDVNADVTMSELLQSGTAIIFLGMSRNVRWTKESLMIDWKKMKNEGKSIEWMEKE